MTLRLTNGICLAELSGVSCVHITVLGKQQFYWVHFDLTDATPIYNLAGWKSTHSVPTPHTRA